VQIRNACRCVPKGVRSVKEERILQRFFRIFPKQVPFSSVSTSARSRNWLFAMSKSANLSSPPPSPPCSEAALYDDRSAVRPRIRPASYAASIDRDVEPESSEGADSDRPTLPSGSNEWVERNESFERKLRFGKIVLQLLAADDARSRLLRAAIADRDEALLEGLLNSLDDTTQRDTVSDSAPASSSQRRTLLPPPKHREQR
jgi:hypothetical protein